MELGSSLLSSTPRRLTQTSARANPRDAGMSLIEVLVAITLLSLSGLAISNSAIHAFQSLKFVELNHVANILAISKMEEIAARDTVEIDTSLNGIESSVEWADLEITFSRSTDVTVNADGSRSVVISVSTNDQVYATTVRFQNTFALWE